MFFAGAMPATHLAHGDALGTSGSLDWSLDNQGRHFLGAALSLGTLWFAYMCTTLMIRNDVGDSSKPVSLVKSILHAESCTKYTSGSGHSSLPSELFNVFSLRIFPPLGQYGRPAQDSGIFDVTVFLGIRPIAHVPRSKRSALSVRTCRATYVGWQI